MEGGCERVAMLLECSGHGQFRGGKFSLPLRRFLSVSSQEEVFQGLAVFVVGVLRMHASRSGRNAIRSFEVGINFGEDF